MCGPSELDHHRWRLFQPQTPQPNPRYGTAYIFDPQTRQVVTFAGFTDQGRFDDTWRFDVDAQTWIEVTTAEINPPCRCLHSGSYDSRNHQMIIYGGQQSGPLGDIWALDLNDNTWTELTPPESPEGRYFAANIYDRHNHRLIIFGGNKGAGSKSIKDAFNFLNSGREYPATAAH